MTVKAKLQSITVYDTGKVDYIFVDRKNMHYFRTRRHVGPGNIARLLQATAGEFHQLKGQNILGQCVLLWPIFERPYRPFARK